MAKIAYPDKQTAVNPASPAANEVYTAANANEVKNSVNVLYDMIEVVAGIVDPATADYDSTTLNAAYPSALIGTEILCPYNAGGPIIYKKVTASVWYSLPMGTV